MKRVELLSILLKFNSIDERIAYVKSHWNEFDNQTKGKLNKFYKLKEKGDKKL